MFSGLGYRIKSKASVAASDRIKKLENLGGNLSVITPILLRFFIPPNSRANHPGM